MKNRTRKSWKNSIPTNWRMNMNWTRKSYIGTVDNYIDDSVCNDDDETLFLR